MQTLNDQDRRSLVPGDRVLVRLDSGEHKEFVVKYQPWELGGGTLVIGLQGIAGGYLLSRVVGRPILNEVQDE